MTKEEILKRVKKFQGANREFSQELPPIIEGLVDLIDEAGPEVVDSLESNDPDKALSANMGKELNVSKMDAPSVTGEAGQILQLDEEGNPEWVEAAAVGATYDSAVSDTSTNAIQNKTIKKYVDDNFAQKDGYYGSLTAGAAENLVGRGSVPAEFSFRTSGGDQDLGTGSALITKILGRTLVWNQLVQNGDFSDGTTGWGASGFYPSVYSASGGVLTITPADTSTQKDRVSVAQTLANSIIVGHTYLVKIEAKVSEGTKTLSGRFAGVQNDAILFSPSTVSTSWATFTATIAASYENTRLMLFFTGAVDNAAVDLKNVMLIDLTLLGWVPSTAEEFRALFPLSYYAYTPALLINNAATDLESTGFNQWDEETEANKWIDAAGNVEPKTGYMLAKNKTIVLPDTTYYIKSPNACYIYFYDASGSFISKTVGTRDTTFVTPSNCAFLQFYVSNSYGTTYKNDICINLSWSGYRNGEYEPYEKHTLNLGLNNIACHDEDDTAVVVNGLDGVGTSQDELIVENGWGTKIIKNRARVDLGILTWGLRSGSSHTFDTSTDTSGITNSILKPATADTPKVACSRYTPASRSAQGLDTIDKSIGVTTTGYLVITDTAYTDAATFKAAMAGVYMDYELDTPKVLTLDNPIPASYYVNDFGTEARLPQDTVDNPQAPFCAEIRYAMNATDTIRRLPSQYISDESMTNILTALKTAGIIADFTLTYDSEHQYYTCSITAPTTEGE